MHLHLFLILIITALVASKHGEHNPTSHHREEISTDFHDIPTASELATAWHPVHDSPEGVTSDGDVVRYKCDTTAGSPRFSDIVNGAWYMMSWHKLNQNCGTPDGAKCYREWWDRTGVISTCGTKTAHVECGTTGEWVLWLAKKCEWFGYTGGRIFYVNKGITVYVYHTGDM